MKFTDEQIGKILCLAVNRKVLILTVQDRTAVELKDSIVEYLYNHNMGQLISKYQSTRGQICFYGAFETITVQWVYWWNSHQKCALYLFDGLVFVTNRCITDVQHIKGRPRLITEIWFDDKNGTAAAIGGSS